MLPPIEIGQARRKVDGVSGLTGDPVVICLSSVNCAMLNGG